MARCAFYIQQPNNTSIACLWPTARTLTCLSCAAKTEEKDRQIVTRDYVRSSLSTHFQDGRRNLLLGTSGQMAALKYERSQRGNFESSSAVEDVNGPWLLRDEEE